MSSNELPPLHKQVANFTQAHLEWVKAGGPTRTPEEIESLFKGCEQCAAFMRVGTDLGRCTDCGCWLKREGYRFNKLAMQTEQCPRGKF